jgi:hypothetical protein
VGKKALTKFFREHSEEIKAIDPFVGPYKLEKIRTDGHFLIHPVISVAGDRATGTWMEYNLTSEPITMTLLYLVQATYDVEYVKRDGKWLIYSLDFQRTIEPVRPGERIGRGAPLPDQK